MININDILANMGIIKASVLNNLTYVDYYERLKLIALSLFEWHELPKSCNARFLESTLFTYGRAVFVFDKELGYLTTKCTPSGSLNLYDEPISYLSYGVNYSHEYEREECVLIRNNYLERPTQDTICLFALRLSESERTLDVNIKQQKTPSLMSCDEKTKLSIKNIYKNIDGNEPNVFVDKSIDVNGIKVYETVAPFVADKVMLYKRDIWNECMSFLGVNNANTDKKERLITDEVNANNDLIDIMAQTMFLTRQDACTKINEMYGLNVSVTMRNVNNGTEETDEPDENEDKKDGE